ncbi:MAG: iron ABC transporter permease [Chloroflexota bacterium]|nr:iron ABC transporter permease [Chloroflexota bacterium]
MAKSEGISTPWPKPAAGGSLKLPRPNAMVTLATVPALIILGLLILTVVVSLQRGTTDGRLTLEHYVSLYTDSSAYQAMLNTLGFGAVTLLVSMFFGLPMAWLVERTDLGAKSLMYAIMTVGVLIPGFFTAMGWLFLLHPRIGLVNQLLMKVGGRRLGPLSILSVAGMGWVQGLGLTALVFVMASTSLRSMDSSLEESAQASGAGFLTTMRRVTLPLAFPGILAAALYVVPIAFSAADIPLIIGLSARILTFSTYVYTSTDPVAGLPEYGKPAAFSVLMIALALALSWWYSRTIRQARRYQVVTGRSYRPRLVGLGRWKPLAWAFLASWILLAVVLPLLLVIWAALLPYFQAPSLAALKQLSLNNLTGLPWPLVLRGLRNTAILAAAAPTLALAWSLVFSWVVLRWGRRFRLAYDYVAFLPHAVPGIIFALGALLAALFVVRWPVDLYGSLGLILVVYVVTQIAFGTRMTNSGLVQIHLELEEAAHASGAGTADVLRRVTVPLLKPTLAYAWLWMALFTFRELAIATLLYSPGSITLPVVVWSIFDGGNIPQASAVSLVMMALLVPLVLLYMRIGGGLQPEEPR